MGRGKCQLGGAGRETSRLWFRTIAKVLDSEEGRMAGVSEN